MRVPPATKVAVGDNLRFGGGGPGPQALQHRPSNSDHFQRGICRCRPAVFQSTQSDVSANRLSGRSTSPARRRSDTRGAPVYKVDYI